MASDDSDVAFAAIDFAGVNFDEAAPAVDDDVELSDIDKKALEFERSVLLQTASTSCEIASLVDEDECLSRIRGLCESISSGQYAQVLKGETAQRILDAIDKDANKSVPQLLRNAVYAYCSSVASCVEVELLGVAALNLFLQLNYTGPSLDWGMTPAQVREDPIKDINPHNCFQNKLAVSVCDSCVPEEKNDSKEENAATSTRPTMNTKYQNAVLSELTVDGEWPCQVCLVPYFLLLARSILLTLADPNRPVWTSSSGSEQPEALAKPPSDFVRASAHLAVAHLWSARAAVAHQRLLQSRYPSVTLWNEVDAMFQNCVASFCDEVESAKLDLTKHYQERNLAAAIMLEWGLANHHFDREGKGKAMFLKSMEFSGLVVEVTGAEGKRTKFQQEATAQMLVRAKSVTPPEASKTNDMSPSSDERRSQIKQQMVEHGEDEILLENIEYNDEKENQIEDLNILDQAIILALCLDVKNNNPKDGLTGEQMAAYLARVLQHHDDWMVYSTALLERAWLECERTHGRERAILQIQALTDQHSNRLTITQSTFKSVEDSAPPQERLQNLHTIVYPPRWAMLRDLAERCAKIGVVTSAAEIFEELELWDEVVECYRHAGKESKAEQIVRDRLAISETPRMWAALGDLTNDPSHYEKSLELSNGRFSSAYVALGKYYFDRGELRAASDNFKKALKVKPLMPAVWFRLGTVSMQLEEWETALKAFSEVVLQEPEEADAWANVAAIHLHNKNPSEAYPALVESLKQNRNNWRVWESKLYTCIDLKKYDEAIQACHVLLDMKASQKTSDAIPQLEERCVRAIIGGALDENIASKGDAAALDSSARTLSRVNELLNRLSSTSKTEPWIWEALAYFNDRIGRDDEVYQNLMKEYRALQAIGGWEKEEDLVHKIFAVVSQIAHYHESKSSKEGLTKSKFLISGVLKKIRAAYVDDSSLPDEVRQLEALLTKTKEALSSM